MAPRHALPERRLPLPNVLFMRILLFLGFLLPFPVSHLVPERPIRNLVLPIRTAERILSPEGVRSCEPGDHRVFVFRSAGEGNGERRGGGIGRVVLLCEEGC